MASRTVASIRMLASSRELRIGGTYKVGRQVTPERAAELIRQRYAEAASWTSGAEKAIKPAPEKPEKDVAQTPPEPKPAETRTEVTDPAEMNVEQVRKAVKKISDSQVLEQMREAEEQGKNRSSALTAIEKRLAEV